MPAHAGNSSQLSKDQLKSVLISHNVPVPQGDQRKAVYLQLYLEHVLSKDKVSAEFSSDEEDIVSENYHMPVEDHQKESGEDEMDVKSMSNSDLKEQLLLYGIKPGPILPSTRMVYEKKLQQLLKLQVEESEARHKDQYSDNEDEDIPAKSQLEMRGEKGDIKEMQEYNKANIFSDVPVSRRVSISEGFIMRPPPGPYTHVPASLAAEYKQNLATLGDNFSVTKMLKQMDRRSSLGHATVDRREENYKSVTPSQERMTADKNTMTYRTPTNTPNACLYKARSRQQSDADASEIFDPMSQSLLGMSATRRKPIKGAAGRPIHFKYDDIATRARIQEQAKGSKTGKERLVSVPLQIALFALITLLAVLLYNVGGSSENPFMILFETTKETQP
ncbi:LEM domain-containing protein 1 isoform X1 [Pelobates fuscus]|uniref:LEM domain-containing protein 1 isoform X1 n=1 Tax=Pelobates fuscus TaxID=191477 RepID=UPI002FE4DB25